MTAEQRRYVRLQSSLKTRYKIVSSSEIKHSCVRDVGGDGIRLVTHEAVEEGTTLHIEVLFPDEQVVDFSAAVVWSKERPVSVPDGEPFYETGVRFLHIEKPLRDLLLLQAALSRPIPQ